MDEVLRALADVARIMGESGSSEIRTATHEAERLTLAGQEHEANLWRRVAAEARERRDAWVRLGTAAERVGQ